MDVVTGTDTLTSSAGLDRLLAGIRHLTALADGATSADAMFRALARELLTVPVSASRGIPAARPSESAARKLLRVLATQATPGGRSARGSR